MERAIIFKNTNAGQELTLPVTPRSYPMAAGRAVERLDMAQTGQIALPGLNSLFTGTLEFMLPAQAYPFLTAGAVPDPQYYISRLTAWSAAADVCRYIVAGAGVNIPVLLGPLEYGEQDGSNDVYCKLPLYEYRFLDEAGVEPAAQAAAQAGDGPAAPGSYTVVKGDSLWAICRKFYGDGSLAYKLATANGIKNPNLIYPGQVLAIPDKAALTGYAPTPAPALSAGTQGGSGGSAGANGTAGSEAGVEALQGVRDAAGEASRQAQDAARAAVRTVLGLGERLGARL